MKRFLFATTLAAVLALPTAFSQNAEAIAIKHETAKAAALEEYLKTNPRAQDRDEAELFLMGAYETTGETGKLLPLLKGAYERMPAADIGQKIGLAEEIIQLTASAESKEAAVAFVEKTKAEFKSHPQSAQINKHLDGLVSKPMVGEKMAIAFTATDGTEIDLAKMQDKVILVDFWATWCGPCVQEMPNVTAAYEKHQANGFEVIGISLDKDEAAMQKFIKEKNMPWPQYFDGKGWQNDIAGRFGINSIPATYLIGKDGKIIASNLRGAALEAAVAKALAE